MTLTTDEPAHILVVEDDRRVRELLRKYLMENGFLVTAAVDAADAREKLAAIAFDLIVLDVMMPGETGLQLTADLRQRMGTPILLLTARSEPEDRIAGLESGA
ncbi:MAG: response regulator, partial [Inquilinus limosus]|nr:response regulator [Inquilinus limosus]